jgi:hypothetical protein
MTSRTPPYFYNYYNNDTVTYRIIRLYGKWLSKKGALKVKLNGNLVDNTHWKFIDYDFKVFVRLNPGANNITLFNHNNVSETKSINIYYDPPTLNSTDPIVKLYLYDSYNGTGECDAPPSRTDNKLADNIKRLQLDGLLLQSFFAESLRSARQHQEGLGGLPYSTFQYEMSNNMPKVHYIKTRNPALTAESFWINGYVNGATGLDVSSIAEGSREIYYLGYLLTSHKDPNSDKYGGGGGEGGPPLGRLNSANLIWHPKSLSEMNSVWDDNSYIDFKYNQFDNADTVSQSYARILGSLMHEAGHTFFGFDHPIQLLALTSKVYNPNGMDHYGMNYANPNNYMLPFDVSTFDTNGPYGIMDNDADGFRNWFMAYDIYQTNKISYENSELGLSGKGWWTPFEIKGYVLTCPVSKAGFSNVYIERLVRNQASLPQNLKFHGCSFGTARYGVENSRLIRQQPKLERESNNWMVYSTPNTYTITSPTSLAFAIAFVWGPGSTAATNKSGDFAKCTFLVKSTDRITISVGNINGTNTNIKINGNTVVSVKGGNGTSSHNNISRVCTNSVFKAGNINGINNKKVSFKHILPSIYMSPPPNIGLSGSAGCIMLNYVYIKPNYYKTDENFINFTEDFVNSNELNSFYKIENFTTAQSSTINLNTLANYSMSVLTATTNVPYLFNETPPRINRTDSLPISGRPASVRT